MYALALTITVVSGSLAYRLHLTAYQMVRSFVLGVYGLIVLLMLLDLARVTVGTEAFIPYYAPLSTPLGVLQGIFLLAAAQGIYLSPSLTVGRFPREIAKHRIHAAVLAVFIALAAGVSLYEAAASPYSASMATDFTGNLVAATSIDVRLVALVFAMLFVFLAYPTGLLILGASKVENDRLRVSIYGIAAGWAAVSVLYVSAAASMWVYGFDFMGLMYLANAVIFFVLIRNFRHSASLAGFGGQAHGVREEAVEPTRSLTELAKSLAGKKVFYEVDPSVPYETTLGQTLEELAWAGHAVSVFTPKAGPLNRALSGGTGLKFFLTTGGVSYMKVSEDTSEVLIPQSDTAIFLDVADKTLESRKGNVTFVFDSVSDLLLSIGLEKTYKFLKQFLELLHEQRATAFFIFIKSAHTSKDLSLLRGLFSSHFIEDAEGARMVK